MSFIKQSFVWLSRILYCRGFGIQSPSAYSFVRYVINEHYPYYSYSDLKSFFPDLSRKDRKLYELYFRIANYSQANIWLLCGEFSDVLRSYVVAGRNCSTFTHDIKLISHAGVVLVNDVSLINDLNDVTLFDNLDDILDNIKSGAIFIIESIHTLNCNRDTWNRLVADSRVSQTFDLYYCGIALVDSSKQKQHFIINF